jgi:hypothetical protein
LTWTHNKFKRYYDNWKARLNLECLQQRKADYLALALQAYLLELI